MLKKIEHITGTVVGTLRTGRSALIRRGGDFIRTSLVVEVYTQSPQYACFETMQVIYKVSLATLPAENRMPCTLRLVA